MTDDYQFQTSIHHGQHGQDMTNVRGATAEEFYNNLRKLHGMATDIFLAAETVRAGGVADGNGGADAPSPPANSQPAQVAQPAPGGQGQNPPLCAHNMPRNYGSGVKKDGSAWAAWFCGLPKGSAGSCAPEWIS